MNKTWPAVIIRLVRMTFRLDAVEEFLSIYDESAPRIRGFEGCRHLELWQDPSAPHILTTYSHWKDAGALEAYRRSDLFRATWRRTKLLFASPPQAFSHVPLRENGGHVTPNDRRERA